MYVYDKGGICRGGSRGTSTSLDLTFPPTGFSENLGEWKGEGREREGCETPPALFPPTGFCLEYHPVYDHYYAPAPRVGALSSDAGLTSVCLSVTYSGPKSRTERPRKTKIDTDVAHITRDWDTTFGVKRSKVNLTCRGENILWRPPAQRVNK